MFPKVEVTIDKDGNVQLHVQGVKGLSCTDLTAQLEAALGGDVTDKNFTPEAFEGDDGETAGVKSWA